MQWISSIFPFAPLLLVSLAMMSCGPDSQAPENQGELMVKVTDAPVDDAEVQGVFVTVAEVKVDGESYSGFSGAQTIDLMAYQNGETYLLGDQSLEAGTYSRITLVLDQETDAQGNSPGCYVLTEDGSKVDLSGGSRGTLELTATQEVDVRANMVNELVVDVDLRKAIRYQGDDSGSERQYRFASQAELQTSLRAVTAEQAATLTGSFEAGAFADPDKVVVYLYQEGSFNRSQEEAESEADVRFQGAVTSNAATEANGSFSYQLNFVEPGDYEVVLVSMQEEANGSYAFQGFLQTNLSLTGSVTSAVSLEAGANASLNLNILGLIN